MFRKEVFLSLLCLFSMTFPGPPCRGDETELLAPPVPPDVLIIVDFSESMKNDPGGNPCAAPGCTKMEIARKAVFDLLDDNRDGRIDRADEESLQVRMGYMRLSGAINPGAATLVRELGSGYADIWNSLSAEVAGGGSPLAFGLNFARVYLENHASRDPAKSCRRKVAILLSDGADLHACNGGGVPSSSDQYKRRKAVIAAAESMSGAGYRVFAVDFGPGMAAEVKNMLNWIAYFGRTDNPSAQNSGESGSLSVSADPCAEAPDINDPEKYPLGGYTFPAGNMRELSSDLKQLGAKITAGRFSFSGFSVSSARNPGENFLYEASFQPADGEPFWRGSLKKFELLPDGRTVELWDAGARLQTRRGETRNLVTYTGLTPFRDVLKDSLGAATEAEREFIVNYLYGLSSNPENWKLGDIFHSNPVAVGSPSPFFDDFRSGPAFAGFREQNKDRPRMVFAGANDGQFHAFTDEGEERWSFIPPNLLPKLKALAHAHPLRDGARKIHRYFVDGPVTAADVWLGGGTGKTKRAEEWQTLLVFGEGRGARNAENISAYLWSASTSCERDFLSTYDSAHPYYCGYYAFNITDTGAALPEFKWLIKPRAGEGSYLGEPWSRMVIGRILVDGGETWVGFIGGGFNPGSSRDGPHRHRGKGFFVVRLSDGAVLWSRTNEDNPAMDHSIPASPTPVDTDGDGFIDTVYVGDLGGNMWRFKFCTREDEEDAAAGSHCGTGDWRGGLLFQSSSGFIRPIFTPAIAARDKESIWVFWGSGNKENPLEIPTGPLAYDKFIALRDDDRRSSRNIDDLENINEDTYRGTRPGWYIDLLGRGEKIISNSTVFGGMVLFQTFTPHPPGDDPCTREGSAQFYALAMMPIKITGKLFTIGAGVLSDPSENPATGGVRKIPLPTGGLPTALAVSQRLGIGASTEIYISISGESARETKTKALSPDIASSPLSERLKNTPARAQMIHWRDLRVR